MPYAVTHVLLTIIVLDIFRDYVIKDKKSIPLHFIQLAIQQKKGLNTTSPGSTKKKRSKIRFAIVIYK